MTLPLILNLAVALLVCVLLYRMQAAHASFTKRVFTGLGLGVVLGAALQAIYGAGSPAVAATNDWLDVLGSGYVKLLQMIVIPLIMVSIIGAILKLRDAASLGKISALTIGILIATTAVAAMIGILMAKLFGLTAVGLTASVGGSGARRIPAGLAVDGQGNLAAVDAALLHSRQSLPRHDRRAQDLDHRGRVLLGLRGHRRHRHCRQEAERIRFLQPFRARGPYDRDAHGDPGAAPDALRRVRPDGEGGGRFEPAGHPEPARLRDGLVQRADPDVLRAPAAGGPGRTEPGCAT